MNQYLRIPRGINVNQENDLILKKTIEEIGKQYGRLLLGKYRSNYAKGKAFLAKEYGLSKTAIKKMHTVKISASGHNNIGDNYSNYVSLHILLTDRIIVDIIKSIKEQKIDFERIATDISNSKYNSGDLYIDALFEETRDGGGEVHSNVREKFLSLSLEVFVHADGKCCCHCRLSFFVVKMSVLYHRICAMSMRSR